MNVTSNTHRTARRAVSSILGATAVLAIVAASPAASARPAREPSGPANTVAELLQAPATPCFMTPQHWDYAFAGPLPSCPWRIASGSTQLVTTQVVSHIRDFRGGGVR
jgi:hypothetical protein